MTFAILGSGFGLYGYLPALMAGCGQRVVLPERYRDRMKSREELRRFVEEIDWREDDAQVLAAADGAVFARRPGDQMQGIDDCLRLPNIRKIILEKPPAPTPDKARALLELLRSSGKGFRIAFTFRHTAWGRRLLEADHGGISGLEIDWRFQAHHYQHDLQNWKRSHSQGGGALRFYGIHLVALLAEKGYATTEASKVSGESLDDAAQWEAVFSGPGLPPCRVRVDSRSKERCLRITAQTRDGDRRTIVSLDDPFSHITPESSLAGLDQRTGILALLCRGAMEGDGTDCGWYERAINLWDQAERQT